MKTILLYLFLLLFGLQLSAQLQEDFETWPPEDWSIYTYGTSSLTWDSVTSPHTGIYAAFHYYSNQSQDCNSWLVTPQIVSLPDSFGLIFYERNGDMSYYDYSGVLISTGSGDPMSGDFVQVYESNVSKSSYTLKLIDLSAYSGQDIYIAFNYSGTWAHYWYIDDVSIQKIDEESFSLQPVSVYNPYDGETNISPYDVELNWNESSGICEGYKIYFGTDGEGIESPTNILDGEITTYSDYYFPDLDYSTTYYLQIVPFNEIKEAENCPIYQFTTMDKVYLTPPFLFDFNDYQIPADWNDFYIYQNNTLIPGGDFWQISSFMNNSENSPGIACTFQSETRFLSLLPSVILGGSVHQYSLEFDMAVTPATDMYPDTLDNDDTLALFISNNETYNNLRSEENLVFLLTHEDSLGYGKHYKIDVNYFSDTVNLAFYANSQTFQKYSKIFIDNFGFTMKSECDSLMWFALDGRNFDNFRDNKDVYDVKVHDLDPPVVTAGALDPLARVIIDQADGVPGTATIQVIAENMNFSRIYSVNFFYVSDINKDLSKPFEIYPNPATTELHFSCPVDRYVVRDITGKEVLSGSTTDLVNVEDLKSGYYMIELSKGGKNSVYKIIKK